jgi:hypothetical protein
MRELVLLGNQNNKNRRNDKNDTVNCYVLLGIIFIMRELVFIRDPEN